MAISQDEARDYIGTLLRHFPTVMNRWENQFVASLKAQLDADAGRTFTAKQLETLDQIMEKCAVQHGERYGGDSSSSRDEDEEP